MGDKRVILLLSGGIDSTVTMNVLARDGFKVHALVFHYGQTLAKEVDVAIENHLHLYQRDREATVEPIATNLSWLAPECALLAEGTKGIPLDRSLDTIAKSGTPPTYVPFRNGIMLAYAVAYGEAHGIESIFCGGNGLNSGNYYDDTAEFARAFQFAADEGTSPNYRPRILFPMADLPKREVVSLGIDLGVDFTKTWSCYLNGDHHCGRCDSCAQRIAAFDGRMDLHGRLL